MAAGKDVKKSACFLTFLLVVACGTLAWLFFSGSQVQDQVNCVVDTLNTIRDEFPALEADLVEDDGQKMIDDVKTYGPMFVIFSILPGSFVILWLILVVACACRTEGGKGYYCAKVFLFLSQVFIILGIAFYLAMAALAVLMNSDQVMSHNEELQSNCKAQEEVLREQIALAGDYVEEKESAEKQIDLSANLCGCASGIVDKMQNLLWPSIANTVVFIIIFIWALCLCCHMGCFCKNAGADEKKEPVKMDGVQFARP